MASTSKGMRFFPAFRDYAVAVKCSKFEEEYNEIVVRFAREGGAY